MQSATINFEMLMNTKCLIGAVVVLGAIGAAPAVMANSIVLTQTAYSYADGGEFTAHTSPQDFLGAYVPSTMVNGGFQTFCVEASVTFVPGTTYSYTLSNMDSQGRALTKGAAFLYYEFATGILSGYDYNNAANRQIDAGQLQSAIWNLQGNQSGGGSFPNGGTGNSFYDLAVANLGAANITAADNGSSPVEFLQLWDDAGNAHQNQLVLVHVPDAGSSSALMAMGLAGLGVAKFRTRRVAK
jgi:hypothetical protein